MLAYIIRRLLLVIPTLFGIMLINFVIVQAAPGGPIDQVIAQIRGAQGGALARVSGGGTNEVGGGETRASRGIDPKLIAELRHQFGFDKPPAERFLLMMGDYLRFDFGNSFFENGSVIDLIGQRLPVSISLGAWTTLLGYLISIPLGIRKAVRDGSSFDVWTSAAIIVGYSIPSFLFAILLIVLFAGGSYFEWFPLRGLVSDSWASLPWPERVVDYLWHLALPVTAMIIGSFANLTMLTKNSFLDEINKQYVITARAKGLSARRVLYGHVFRNAMLIIVANFPAAFVNILFTSALLIEVIFSLNGLGLLGFEAVLNRDYPIIFGTLYIYTLVGIALNLVRDLLFMLVDPRIDFATRGA
ncbi:MAG TPA: microcin C ABC transporter permease YejB [Stellaceae bacterium]|jgi:microcin C transport system permease protein|nr:microcin C ABC transporter permease YejB [Stellaceae bacterium]